ncbi:MAG TPA: hypothetical protein VK207_08950 [Bacteroidales bacterium]|nr:hypothetical protein [Bacteroidales bacterium]
MPILPENKGLYPDNWEEIRRATLARDKYCCRVCGLHDHSVGYRESGVFVPDCGNIIHDMAGHGYAWPDGLPLSHKQAWDIKTFLNEAEIEGVRRWIVIVLTVAHLDHNPANCVPENLASLCQRCHNIYDRAHRNETMRLTRIRKNPQLQLTFCELQTA